MTKRLAVCTFVVCAALCAAPNRAPAGPGGDGGAVHKTQTAPNNS
jgi:hypothetical protein